MKNMFWSFLLVIVLLAVMVMPVLAQSPTPPTPTSPLTLPVELQGLINLFLIFLVTQGLKSLSTLLKFDLSGWASAISAAIVSAVVLFFNALLSAIPAATQPSVAVALTLIVTILGAFGVHASYKGFLAKK